MDLTKSKTHIRESRDSEEHPESFPVFIALDETNRNNLFQGEFWTYEFNEELVLYGINHVQSKFKGWYPTRAIETCCDICEGHTLATLCSYSVKTYKHNFSSICK